MTTRLQWTSESELPYLRIWWEDEDGNLVDFSAGVTAWLLRIGNLGESALLEKTTGITGYAGSGTEPDGNPNVVVTWQPGELNITPGTYTLQIFATFGALGQRALQTPINIGRVVLAPAP